MIHLNENAVLQILDALKHAREHERIVIMADIQVDVNINVSAAQQPLAVDASGVPATATVGTPFVGSLVATGGTPPYNFAVTSGSLPDGLSLGAIDGTITGTPGTVGDFDAVIDVSDSAGATSSVRAAGKVR